MSGLTYLDGSRFMLDETDPWFPTMLSEITDPVETLYGLGDASLPALPALAIVGARKATPYGLGCAHRFARRAAQAGVTVISGGAIGCDQAAHKGALEAGGKTIVVLGCGANVLYPARARPLFEEVLARGGALVSEAPWDAPPTRWSFRQRNRIIATLGWATLIVEAGLPSGTFSTADETLAQGKDILVVPGSIDSKESRGSNRLLIQGAMPIVDSESFDDALVSIFGHYMESGIPRETEYMNTTSESQGTLQLTRAERSILKACTARPMRAEELICADCPDVLQVIRLLSALEMRHTLVSMRDGRYTTTPLAATALCADESTQMRIDQLA